MNTREQIISFLLQTIDQKDAAFEALQAELTEYKKSAESNAKSAKKPELVK